MHRSPYRATPSTHATSCAHAATSRAHAATLCTQVRRGARRHGAAPSRWLRAGRAPLSRLAAGPRRGVRGRTGLCLLGSRLLRPVLTWITLTRMRLARTRLTAYAYGTTLTMRRASRAGRAARVPAPPPRARLHARVEGARLAPLPHHAARVRLTSAIRNKYCGPNSKGAKSKFVSSALYNEASELNFSKFWVK